jgi:hypothetical protein
MTRTLLVRNKQSQHSLPGIAHKQTSSVKKIRCKRATVAPYTRRNSPGNRLSTQWTQATQAIQMLQKCCFSASAISFLIWRTRLDHVTSRAVIGEVSGGGIKMPALLCSYRVGTLNLSIEQ